MTEPGTRAKNVEFSRASVRQLVDFGHPLHISNNSTFRQRDIRPVADDDVIQQPDVHQREGLFNSLGDESAIPEG